MTAVQERVAIVTGGGTGVGAATSKWFAARGWKVLVNYSRSQAEADAVVRDCGEGRAFAFKADVASDADCVAMADAAVKRWGRIDALVNNAGRTQFVQLTDLDALKAEDFHRIYDVNVIGAFQMARAAARHMGAGSAIVNVSSISTVTGQGSSIPYVSSKGAMNALTVTLARALSPKVRVNAVLPGFIESRWLREGYGDATYEKAKVNYVNSVALERVCTPEEIAEAIGFLIEGATLTTGQLLTLDGGLLMGRRR